MSEINNSNQPILLKNFTAGDSTFWKEKWIFSRNCLKYYYTYNPAVTSILLYPIFS